MSKLSRPTTATAITGTGVWHPEHVLDNAELCVAFNEFVRRDNLAHAAEIEAGTRQPLKPSSPEFIEHASGIKTRYIVDKTIWFDDPSARLGMLPERLTGRECHARIVERVRLGGVKREIDFYRKPHQKLRRETA